MNVEGYKDVCTFATVFVIGAIGTGRLVAEGFYNGELKYELHQIGQIEYRFRADSDRHGHGGENAPRDHIPTQSLHW